MTDPHTTNPAPHEAADASPGHVSVVIVGAGFAGLGTAVRLLQEGYRDLLILERADEVGGTWRDNAYPGCACDVPSRLYSFSFAPNPTWSRRFAPQEEIERYLKRCVDRYGLTPRLRLGCELQRATWDPERLRWDLDTSTGPLSAGLLVMAQGPLSEPAIPSLPGLEGFAGEAFHSAGWKHDLDLSAKRVGVIGTGASAVQFIPHLQRTALQVTVFQRTPSWIAPRQDRPVPAWQRRLFRLAPPVQRLARGWEYMTRETTLPALLGNRTMAALGRREALAHLHRQVKDPELRSKLTPDYALGCKRVLLSDNYYPALVQPNVRVVTDPIASVGPNTVLTTPRGGAQASPGGAASAGATHPVDVLIFGTGFRVTDASYAQRVIGGDGRSLKEVWQGSPQAHLGTTVAGFPNLFLMAGPNTGVGHTSLIYMIESQINYCPAPEILALSCYGFRMSFPGRPSVEFVLTADERDQLVGWSRGTSRLAVRARIVLRCAEPDVVYARVADDLGVSAMTVGKWRKRFAESRLEGLADTDRPGRPKTGLSLSDLEREQLTRWARRAKSSQALALRSRIVLACAEDMSNKRVASRLGTSVSTVARWRRRFVELRLEGLADELRPGRPPSILLDRVEEVVVATLETSPRDATHWSRASMAERTGLSKSTIGRIWRQFDLKPHVQDTFKLSTDPQFVEKVVDVVGLYHHPPEKAVVLCVDEKSQVQALDRSQPVLPMMPGMPERRTHDYQRHGVTSLFAAFDIEDGSVISSLHRRHRAVEFKKFLVKIDKVVPAELDVHLICDNYATHKTPAIKAWLGRHPRFHIHFTPTGSSWINQVERWFGHLTDKLIRRGTHRSVQALEADIRTWIQTWNEDPKPFTWTKSADEILNSLAKYIARISGAGHYLVSTLRLMRSRGLGSVDVRAETQHAYNAELQNRMAPTVWAAGGCSGWYQDRTGRVTTIWPASTWQFRRRTRAIDPDEYVLTASRVAPDQYISDGSDRVGVGEAQPGS